MHASVVPSSVLEDTESLQRAIPFPCLTISPFPCARCVWCQRLEPTWEKFAEDIEAAALPITVAKV
jgi:hypothetical protein